MANPEYEAKINPADLYNDEILETFESIRSVIHKEILPSTYNELIVTSNQAGVFNSEFSFGSFPSTELIFPLSPQSGNVNWLEKNFLRFKLIITDNNNYGCHLTDFNHNYYKSNNATSANAEIYTNTILGIQDGASIFKSIELNYGGTAIWTSAYQGVEAFFTYANIPNSLVEGSPQYFNNFSDGLGKLNCSIVKSSNVDGKIGGSSDSKQDSSGSDLNNKNPLIHTIYIDIDISRLSPILSWLSIIPGFINKLTLRVILESPSNYLCLKFKNSVDVWHKDFTAQASHFKCLNQVYSSWVPIAKDGADMWPSDNTPGNNGNEKKLLYSNITWKMDLCEIHQCNATMTEDTRIRLISLIQQMGGKWIYPCRYWNTTIAPIQSFIKDTTNSATFQFVLTGCYFRSLSFILLKDVKNSPINWNIANGCAALPNISNLKIFADSELIANYNNVMELLTDTDSALIDNDKYSIPKDILASLLFNSWKSDVVSTRANGGFYRDCINKSLGPPNGLYSGKYTSEKMGTHNIIVQMTFKDPDDFTAMSWLGALQDGVIVFDNFNGNYFTTGRKMQQIYEALT